MTLSPIDHPDTWAPKATISPAISKPGKSEGAGAEGDSGLALHDVRTIDTGGPRPAPALLIAWPWTGLTAGFNCSGPPGAAISTTFMSRGRDIDLSGRHLHEELPWGRRPSMLQQTSGVHRRAGFVASRGLICAWNAYLCSYASSNISSLSRAKNISRRPRRFATCRSPRCRRESAVRRRELDVMIVQRGTALLGLTAEGERVLTLGAADIGFAVPHAGRCVGRKIEHGGGR